MKNSTGEDITAGQYDKIREEEKGPVKDKEPLLSHILVFTR